MDRFVANTLRTLGIILTSIFVICGCVVLLALALCFGIIANAGGHSDPGTSALATGAFVAAGVLIAVGIFVVTVLAKGMVHASDGLSTAASYTLIPPSAQPRTGPTEAAQPEAPTPAQPLAPKPVSDEAKLDHALKSLEAMAKRAVLPTSPEPPKTPQGVAPPLSHAVRQGGESAASVTPTRVRALSRPVDIDHLSPASRSAIQQLGFAIAAKIVAEVALGIVGWYGALTVPRWVQVPFPLYRFGFIAWGLAAIAPHLVLLYALARRPGPRAFAYALVIPSLHLLLGIFGHSAFLSFVTSTGQIATPLLSILPWLIDILILYLAWKAIRLTGIEPPPSRLIVAAVVIFFYSSFLPALVVFLNWYQTSLGSHPLP